MIALSHNERPGLDLSDLNRKPPKRGDVILPQSCIDPQLADHHFGVLGAGRALGHCSDPIVNGYPSRSNREHFHTFLCSGRRGNNASGVDADLDRGLRRRRWFLNVRRGPSVAILPAFRRAQKS